VEQRWSAEAAARELSDRIERAGLTEVWSRPARERIAVPPVFAFSTPPAADNVMTHAVAARLAPAVETITGRYATRKSTTEQRRQRSSALIQAAQAGESAAVVEAEVETPLRRLAALGRITHDLQPPDDAAHSPANGRDVPAIAALSSPRRSERSVWFGSGQEASSSQADPRSGDDSEFAEKLAGALYREALRNGIDPLEYES
jgi:hypothetical protein